MKKYEIIELLLNLARLGALRREIFISTKKLAKELGISRQSVHRKIKELERRELIARRLTARGQYVKITQKGEDVLRSFHHELEILLGEVGILNLEGRVFTGIGEGAYYVSHPFYEKQFIEKLGFKPHPGTLNIRLTPESMKNRKKLESMKGILVEGFVNKGRSYGGVKCFKALINGSVKGGILLIERTHYGPDVIEVIAPVNLRERLKLRDGDLVRVEVSL